MIDPGKCKHIILTSHPDAGHIALDEIRAVDSGTVFTKWLSSGIGHATLGGTWELLAKSLRKQPPIFCRHICPAQIEMPLKQDMSDPDRLADAAESLIPHMDAGRSFSVQTRLLGDDWPFARYEINNRLADALGKGGAPLDVRKPVQVLSVVLTPSEGYMGLSRAENNLSDWAGGVRRFKREEEQVSRSEFKLLEALEIFGLRLPMGGKALDMGAAPGGWTRILLKQSMHVTAVDPADLHPQITSNPAVRHVRKRAEDYLPRARERFDVICNDMRDDARKSAALMLTAGDYLRPDGFALMTLKLPARKMKNVSVSALKLLRRKYRVVGARQLFHNRYEITVALRKIVS